MGPFNWRWDSWGNAMSRAAVLCLTGNTDTVYCSVILDLKTDDPTVIEIPPGTGPGTVNDAFFRVVTDTGPLGPDKAKGGK